jgi:hypothetical protein
VEEGEPDLLMRFSHESVIKNGLSDGQVSIILAILPKTELDRN